MDPTTDRLLFDLRLHRRLRLDARTTLAPTTSAGATTSDDSVRDPRTPRRGGVWTADRRA